ncbi:MAG: universal stress protein [Actinomycetota bacterium]
MTTLSDDLHASTSTPADGILVVADDHSAAARSAAAWAETAAAVRQLEVLRIPVDDHDPKALTDRLPGAARTIVVGSPKALHRSMFHTLHIDALLCHTDVVVVPQDYAARPGAPILVAVDGSAADHDAVETAFEAASRTGAPLVAVHCWKETGALGFPAASWCPIDWADDRERECALVAESLAGLSAQNPGVVVDRVVRTGMTGSALIPLARTAQLVVMSGHGTGMTNTTMSALIRDAEVPVLIASTDAMRRS